MEEPMVRLKDLTVRPIGYISTPYQDRYEAPRQPGVGISREGIITLAEGMNFEQALTDLKGFDRIWLLYWFDRNPNWKPMVLTPRSAKKHGLFATRSPHRPNPIGMSVVDLLEIRGRILRVGNVDLLDGTPILDIKPYIPYADAYPDSKIGWVDDIPDVKRHTVIWSDLASEQVAWLSNNFGVDLKTRAEEVLSQDPEPHPYRRISKTESGYEMSIRSWRLDFKGRNWGKEIFIKAVRSGYSSSKLAEKGTDEIHDEAAHLAFHARWPAVGT